MVSRVHGPPDSERRVRIKYDPLDELHQLKERAVGDEWLRPLDEQVQKKMPDASSTENMLRRRPSGRRTRPVRGVWFATHEEIARFVSSKKE